jgi:hypothetical protein
MPAIGNEKRTLGKPEKMSATPALPAPAQKRFAASTTIVVGG